LRGARTTLSRGNHVEDLPARAIHPNRRRRILDNVVQCRGTAREQSGVSMRHVWVLAFALAGCFSTRQLARPDDLRLREPDHHDGFVAASDGPWRARVDADTAIRFANKNGEWTDSIWAARLHVDPAGVWVDRSEPWSRVVDAVRLGAPSEQQQQILRETRPAGATLQHNGKAWVLRASPGLLDAWLDEVYDAARLANCAWLHEMSVHHIVRGWQPVHWWTSSRTLDTREGWAWPDISKVEVTNLSGAKTFGALVGYSALTVAMLPLAALGAASPAIGGPNVGAPSIGGGSSAGDAPPPGTWLPSYGSPADQAARPLFANRERFAAIADPMLSFDGATSRHGDLQTIGMLARIRFGEAIEIGGGVREALTQSRLGQRRSTEGVFAVGLHLPLDAGAHFALPVGFEVGGGDAVDVDVRFPWGIRYNARHWFATITPATPEYLHLNRDDAERRWTIVSGGELGWRF
jgi:hypothetical protein